MKVVAIYNMKGGVGKTTTAVNLSYLAAAGGARVLLWDLDPQAAASFAFRVRPCIKGFSKKSLESGRALVEAIKETDYANLHLLPADFAYRKLDRFLDHLGKPKRVVTTLIETIGAEYDVVFLDCPAGFSLITEGIFAAADVILVPAVPAVLSLRTLVQLMKWADRSDSPADLVAFFSMVDWRKTLHRQACERSRDYPDIFLSGLVPYASIVEQSAVNRLPLAVFAPRDAATAAFAAIWSELESRVPPARRQESASQDRWKVRRRAVETLMARLESSDEQDPGRRGNERRRSTGAIPGRAVAAVSPVILNLSPALTSCIASTPKAAIWNGAVTRSSCTSATAIGCWSRAVPTSKLTDRGRSTSSRARCHPCWPSSDGSPAQRILNSRACACWSAAEVCNGSIRGSANLRAPRCR